MWRHDGWHSPLLPSKISLHGKVCFEDNQAEIVRISDFGYLLLSIQLGGLFTTNTPT